MADLRVNGLSFERGIENIAYAGKEASGNHLPDRQDLPPSADGVRAQLDQLLDKPGVRHFLEDALRPQVGNRELLMPAVFSRALANACAELEKAAEEGTADSRALNRALRLLKEETGLRELVSMYRSALYQG